jgi:hypothetical protein
MLVTAGRAFKSAIVEISYEADMRLHVLEAIGGMIHIWDRKETLGQSHCQSLYNAVRNTR